MELQHKQSKSVAATCFSFLSGDANNFIVGSEECMVYSGSRHGRYISSAAKAEFSLKDVMTEIRFMKCA